MTSRSDPISPIVLTVAAVLFIASGINALSALHSSHRRTRAQTHASVPFPANRRTSESAVQVSYTVDNIMCSASPSNMQSTALMRAGSLLKLIDVVAGVAARRHSSLPCVTVSVDSVLILRPVWAGEIIHLSASVNRAWGSSLEVGVRIDKDKGSTGGTEYVSHEVAEAYMTFVALPDKGPSAAPRAKVQLPSIAPQSRLEARRHLLAGVRRSKRIEDAQRGEGRDGVSTLVKQRVREEVLAMCDNKTDEEQGRKGKAELKDLIDDFELEFMARAMSSGDPALLLDEKRGVAEVRISGDEPLIHSLEDVKRKQATLSVGEAYARRGTLSNLDLDDEHTRLPSAADVDTPVLVSNTLARSLHLVFPEHANSHNILFGGNTMSWLELAAHLSAARLLPARSDSPTAMWRTLTLDHLPFPHPAHVGDVMEFFAVVLRTWVRSCEVYVLATVERQGETGGRRWTNDALLTLALREEVPTTRLRPVAFESGSALELFASAADGRKEQRLELRDLLMRLYG